MINEAKKKKYCCVALKKNSEKNLKKGWVRIFFLLLYLSNFFIMSVDKYKTSVNFPQIFSKNKTNKTHTNTPPQTHTQKQSEQN